MDRCDGLFDESWVYLTDWKIHEVTEILFERYFDSFFFVSSFELEYINWIQESVKIILFGGVQQALFIKFYCGEIRWNIYLIVDFDLFWHWGFIEVWHSEIALFLFSVDLCLFDFLFTSVFLFTVPLAENCPGLFTVNIIVLGQMLSLCFNDPTNLETSVRLVVSDVWGQLYLWVLLFVCLCKYLHEDVFVLAFGNQSM